MDIRLDGRSAVITGGSKGLGLAMAQRFAASGADVAILARTPETLALCTTEIELECIDLCLSHIPHDAKYRHPARIGNPSPLRPESSCNP